MKIYYALLSLLLPTIAVPSTETYLPYFLHDAAANICPPTHSVFIECINSCGHRVECCSGMVEQINTICAPTLKEAQERNTLCKEKHFREGKPQHPCLKKTKILMTQKQIIPGKEDGSENPGIFICGPKKRRDQIPTLLTILSICSIAPRTDGSYDRSAPLIKPCDPRCGLKQHAFNTSAHQSPTTNKPTRGRTPHR